MSLIEGIGDEVLALAACLVLATTLVAAWFSTNVRERPGPQVRVVQTRITHIRTNQQNSPNSTSTSGVSQTASTVTLERRNAEGASEERTSVQSASERPHDTDPQRTNDGSQSIEDVSNSGVVENTEESTSLDQAASLIEENKQNEDTDSGKRKEESTCSNGDQGRGVSDQAEGATSNVEVGIDSNSNTDKQRTDSENVLRNRNTGRVYPTLPTHGSTEQASGGVSEEASHVEEIRTDEETSQSQEGSICIRVKFSNDTERMVNTTPEETLGQFRRQNFVDELEAGKLVRFIANGQFLSDDNQTISSLNLTNNSVLHCHVTQGETIRQTQHTAQDGDLDLGQFMVPLFGCILAFVWYLRWQYRYMFNATSTLSLIGVTVLFFLAVLAAWRA